jgi:hypothetical protein
VKVLYKVNYETLMKKLKRAQINVKIFHVHGWEELILIIRCEYINNKIKNRKMEVH